MNKTILCLGLSSLALIGNSEAKDKPHATIIVGTHHYSPHKTMPKLAAELERLGFDVALINPQWDAEKDKRGLAGLEILNDTDVAVFFVRFLTLEGGQYQQMIDYVQAGKPVVCLRTSTHAFNYPETHKNHALNIDFPRETFGTPYRIHLAGKTEIEVVKGAEENPILTGVSGKWSSPGTLYLTDTSETIVPLLQGSGSPRGKKASTRTNAFGTHELKPTMTDTIAWTWQNKWGGKAFTTSLGHPGDFAVPQSMRVIINGIHWAAGAQIPAESTEVKTFK